MNILAIECTHSALSTAVMNAGVVTEIRSDEWMKAAETLVPLIEEVMAESALQRQQLDCIAISSGPGSFTSLRIGMAVAKGIAYALGIPLVAVPTLPAMAASLPAGSSAGRVMAVIPARKGEYYYADYLPEELSSGLWRDEVRRGSAGDVAGAAAQSGGTVVVGRRLDEITPLPAASGAVYAEADFFSARSLFPQAERLFAGTNASELNGVTPDYRQMFTPNGGRE